MRQSVNDGSSDAFMWETFTTKPFHDSGEVKRVGDVTTPWPCFMLAALRKSMDTKLDEIRRAFLAVQEACEIFASEAGMVDLVASRYDLQPCDAAAWYNGGLKICCAPHVSEAGLERAMHTLQSVGVVPSDKPIGIESLIDSRLAHIEKDIKSVKLYRQPELIMFVYNELRELGKSDGPLAYTDLLPFDQHHYHGTQALEECVQLLQLQRGSRIVNIGSGLGGPARYFAGKYGSEVLAVELQDDLHRTALELTHRCGLQSLVHHMAADFLSIAPHLAKEAYDFVVSWLSVLHIPNRLRLFSSSLALLRPGGFFFADDFYQRKTLTREELIVLKNEVYCQTLPTEEQYKKQLSDVGFVNIRFIDMSEEWTRCTAERIANFRQNSERHTRVHGASVVDGLADFYQSVSELFRGGNLGGVRIIAQRPHHDSDLLMHSSSIAPFCASQDNCQ
eukprot:gnl/Hemi2/243_TR64_c0_g1_i1.p1 gnl/Hemi2/243_TR64_c0_g1~~gnl/Hemi2/243_TR64_c0_g1_i1.p1  ORF type:complete len:508 (-),score=126.05 gnl/Hemi2/243_TR64_c0_g1_i1:19-1362(-)